MFFKWFAVTVIQAKTFSQLRHLFFVHLTCGRKKRERENTEALEKEEEIKLKLKLC